MRVVRIVGNPDFIFVSVESSLSISSATDGGGGRISHLLKKVREHDGASLAGSSDATKSGTCGDGSKPSC